ncbi:uncharacterized protein FOMMEDRAFT_154738 [Fomitiporia mediterranea MF3/22]|uniref:uncharacterized protein n=1 Tax=Fomitiporia mediterranea (strain MF3/22) TaxID=694068 RepID=UPI0004407F1D|nr:uncharacterized protein FOMMEDRAFT_154738 [Fomitiporia mediterranea MF3/22]EJD03641.1 hypothetical protein FOMMEDRAFT_154738 [Fomitiporia mediterranea MF3/22]
MRNTTLVLLALAGLFLDMRMAAKTAGDSVAPIDRHKTAERIRLDALGGSAPAGQRILDLIKYKLICMEPVRMWVTRRLLGTTGQDKTCDEAMSFELIMKDNPRNDDFRSDPST